MENLEAESEIANSGKASPSNAPEKVKKPSNREIKVKINLSLSESSRFGEFIQATKLRGIKNLDLGEFILDAMAEFTDDWWDEKLERLTPLEYKINAALSDPNMREKLTELLASEKMEDSEDGALHS